MDKNKKEIILKHIEKTAEKLQDNNMEAYIVNSKDEVVEMVRKLINKGDTISTGGSMSLNECGVMDLLKSGDYNFIDRTVLSPEETLVKTCTADVFMCSSNAVTENGELYNVDGNSNRISAIAYGPKSVIMVVGYNKIVLNIDEAINRVKTMAAPANAERLNIDTYCRKKGECVSLSDKNADMCSGCKSDNRICCNYLVSSSQRHKNRIKVILVADELGY